MRNESRHVTDDEVREFIRKARTAEPRSTRTKILKQLRDSGQACEQARFRKLFLEETTANHGR